jgi:hypothetical protein
MAPSVASSFAAFVKLTKVDTIFLPNPHRDEQNNACLRSHR